MRNRSIMIILLCALLALTGCAKPAPIQAEGAAAAAPVAEPPVREEESMPDEPPEIKPHVLAVKPQKHMEPVKLEVGGEYKGEMNNAEPPATVKLIVDPEAEDAQEDEDVYCLVVTDAQGKENKVRSEPFTYFAEVWLCDLDEDGAREIFFSQAYTSDDHSLQCWHFENGSLKALHFTTGSYGQSNTSFYGLLDALEGSEIVIAAHIDILGTREGRRRFALDGYSFTPAEGSRWEFDPYYMSDNQETWNNYGLELAKDMPVKIDGEETVLGAGTKLLLTSTDYESDAEFMLRDGRLGVIEVCRADDGWSWLIGGEPEQDWFTSYLPYAG